MMIVGSYLLVLEFAHICSKVCIYSSLNVIIIVIKFFYIFFEQDIVNICIIKFLITLQPSETLLGK